MKPWFAWLPWAAAAGARGRRLGGGGDSRATSSPSGELSEPHGGGMAAFYLLQSARLPGAALTGSEMKLCFAGLVAFGGGSGGLAGGGDSRVTSSARVPSRTAAGWPRFNLSGFLLALGTGT